MGLFSQLAYRGISRFFRLRNERQMHLDIQLRNDVQEQSSTPAEEVSSLGINRIVQITSRVVGLTLCVHGN